MDRSRLNLSRYSGGQSQHPPDLEGTYDSSRLKVAGLFAGIGGIELGFDLAGHVTQLLCEIDPAAQAVLRHRFPGVELVGDIRRLNGLPDIDVVAAGFPCQDLSQAGRTAGIGGLRSGLVEEVFRLLGSTGPRFKWLVLENVPFMLQLERGRAMRFVTETLSAMGFKWAYRVIDSRSFGVPQRRRRVILLASRSEDPLSVLFADEAATQPESEWRGRANGFYWTEGTRGLGWAPDAIPTLKSGSSVGIPSPPAVWMPNGEIVTPDIRDAERLQGFRADWTLPANEGTKGRGGRGARWKLVGNAVTVPLAEWLGRRLSYPGEPLDLPQVRMMGGQPWPLAAWGAGDHAMAVDISSWPVAVPRRHLADFLEFPPAPLSEKATAGFLARISSSTLRFPEGFKEAVASHLRRMQLEGAVA
jgi:DNA (cytosine-5)-methyltransferase 1